MGILSIGGSGGKTKTSGTETITPWDPTAVGNISGLGGVTTDLSDILGSQLTGWELPYQQALYGSNYSMLPSQTGANIFSNEEFMRDILANRDVKDLMRGSYADELSKSSPVSGKFYKEAMSGIDPTKEANEAEANVVRSMNKAKQAYDMNLGSYGINPNRMAGQERAFDIATAENIVGAREGAADQAKQDSFNRLVQAMQMKNVAASPLISGLSSLGGTASQNQYGTGGNLEGLLNAIATGGNLFSTLLNPQTVSTSNTTRNKTGGFSIG